MVISELYVSNARDGGSFGISLVVAWRHNDARIYHTLAHHIKAGFALISFSSTIMLRYLLDSLFL